MTGRRTHIMLDVVRCGETAWEAEGRLHGRTDLPITPEGRAVIVALAGRLRTARPSIIHHPPTEAAATTAKILAETGGARAKAADDLAEPDLGLFEGLLASDLAERYPKRQKQWEDEPLALMPPEGEPIAEARARLLGGVGRLLRKTRAGEIGVVVHPIAFAFLRCWFADRPATELQAAMKERHRVVRYAVAPLVVERLREAARTEAPAP